MKNKLLITTALVAVLSATNVNAQTKGEIIDISDEVVKVEDNTIISGHQNDRNNYGGAISVGPSTNELNIGNNVTLENNTTVSSGGSMLAMNGFTAGDGLTIKNSEAKKGGGALYIKLADSTAEPSFSPSNRDIVIGKNALFEGNTSGWGLGGAIAIESANNVTIGDGAMFRNNTGGAIAVWSDKNKFNGEAITTGTTLNLSKATFESNEGTKGGAVANLEAANGATVSNTINIKDSLFTDNKATDVGGAVYNKEGKVDVINSKFANNSATNNGGAIYNSKGTLSITNSEFLENKGVDGGAVYNGNSGTITNVSGIFSGNTASNRGGAIYNSGTGTIDNIEGTFTANKADKGGAISNAGVNSTGIMTISNSTFTDNEASNTQLLGGGAIHNQASASLTFKGNNTFSGNKANGVLNDIYNNGDIEVQGTLTLDGGISGTGTTTFADGSNLNVKTDTTTITNNVINNGANLGLTFENGYAGGQYALITNTGTLDNEFNIAENGIWNINTTGTNGTYEITKKSTDEVSAATGANTNQAGAINAITGGKSESAAFNSVADTINNLVQSSNKSDVQAGLDATTALAPEAAAMVQAASAENANQVFGAVSTRLSGGSIASSSEGMSSGDNLFQRGAMWVQGLINKSKLDDTSKAKGFDADSAGIAMGAEKYINDNTKAGIGYAYTNTDIDGFMRKTDVDTHTAIVYGEYKPSQWFVNGIATYGWSDYSEKRNVAGNQVKADYDVDTIGLQAMTGYDMNLKGYNVTPEAGLRYVHISQDAYRDSVDQEVSGNDSDILTGVIGAKVNKDFALDNGMNLRPEARLAMTYDLVNDDANSVVSLANGSAYQVRGEALDRFGVEVGAGLTADVNDNVEMSVGYEGKFRQDYQDHTGLFNAKYKF